MFDLAGGREVFREPSDYADKYNCQAYARIKDFASELFRTPQSLPPLFREGLFEIQSRAKKKTLLAPHAFQCSILSFRRKVLLILVCIRGILEL